MRCFYHQDQEAVGICKSCAKGLCNECCADVGKGLACKTRCEIDVRTLNDYIDQNMSAAPEVFKSARRKTYYASVFFVLMGVAFLSTGNIYEDDFQLFIGSFMALFGVISAFQAFRMPVASVFPPGHCKKCGYDLRGSASNVCSECGTSA